MFYTGLKQPERRRKLFLKNDGDKRSIEQQDKLNKSFLIFSLKKKKQAWQQVSKSSSCALLKHFSPLQYLPLDATVYMLYAFCTMHIFKS